MARESVTILADTHINSKLGLALPNVAYRDEGDPIELTTIQRWLLPVWEQCLDDIDELTKGYYRTLILNGDIIDIDMKRRTWQLFSRNRADALKLGVKVLSPLREAYDTTFLIRGTEAHTGMSAEGEEELGFMLDTEKDPDREEAYTWWHLRAMFGGVKFDIAHHYSMGTLPHTYANYANKLAFETMWDYYDWGEKPPDVAVRAHNHRFADSGRNYLTRGVFCPAWQYHTSYLHRIGKANAKPHIGAIVFLCDNGEYTMHDFRYRPKRSAPWVNKKLQTLT